MTTDFSLGVYKLSMINNYSKTYTAHSCNQTECIGPQQILAKSALMKYSTSNYMSFWNNYCTLGNLAHSNVTTDLNVGSALAGCLCHTFWKPVVT